MKKIKLKKKEKPVIVEQWIEITRKQGETVVRAFPSNKELEKLRQEMDPQPSLIYRRMNFVHGVPSEYDWTLPSRSVRVFGGMFLQRLNPESWDRVRRQEETEGHTRIVNSGCFEPRPEAFGPCPCPACTAKREKEAA